MKDRAPAAVAPGPPEVSRLVEHLFRHEAGRTVATLTRILGVEHLGLAEDVVQEALARALRVWPFRGVPDNPPAWIMRTARNLALDVVRREQVFRGKEAEIVHSMERDASPLEVDEGSERGFGDDTLRMMFVCCHPAIPPEAQVALALKALGGFSPAEIARAFLTTEAAIAKRLTRARQRIREARIPFEIPAPDELLLRLDRVLRTLYLLFSEGYKATCGERLIREELCDEAIRLTGTLAAHPVGNRPRTHALLALMLLSAARLPARTDDAGLLLRLQEQDRTRWDQSKIARGLWHLAQSAEGGEVSEYHLQAGIAACHCLAPSFAATDWQQILRLYDRLTAFDNSPIVALNRAVAVAEVQGAPAGMAAIQAIHPPGSLDSYYLLHAVLGELEVRQNHTQAAAGHFRRALQLAEIRSERTFLTRRLHACEADPQDRT